MSIVLIAALLGGMWAEKNGNRTARPLIASVALICLLTLCGVQFDMGLWVMVDVAVIYAIERTTRLGEAEHGIIALFPPAWVLYHFQPPGWQNLVTVIVALQFLLTLPWDRLEQLIWKARAA